MNETFCLFWQRYELWNYKQFLPFSGSLFNTTGHFFGSNITELGRILYYKHIETEQICIRLSRDRLDSTFQHTTNYGISGRKRVLEICRGEDDLDTVLDRSCGVALLSVTGDGGVGP